MTRRILPHLVPPGTRLQVSMRAAACCRIMRRAHGRANAVWGVARPAGGARSAEGGALREQGVRRVRQREREARVDVAARRVYNCNGGCRAPWLSGTNAVERAYGASLVTAPPLRSSKSAQAVRVCDPCVAAARGAVRSSLRGRPATSDRAPPAPGGAPWEVHALVCALHRRLHTALACLAHRRANQACD